MTFLYLPARYPRCASMLSP